MENLPAELCGRAAPDGTRVLFLPHMVKELRARAIEGFLALPRRGMEIGGILQGHEERNAIRIEGFQEIQTEHRFGPSFVLSEEDRAHVLAAGIGYFQSFTAREPEFQPPDYQLAREQHPDGDYLLLTLHPVSHSSCLAEFGLFENGELRPNSCSGTFEFDPDEMHLGATPPVPPVAAEPEAPPPPPAVPVIAVPVFEEIRQPVAPVEPAYVPEPPYEPEPAPVSEPVAAEAPPVRPLPPSYRAQTPPPPPTWEGEAVAPVRHRSWPLILALVLASALLGAALYQVWILSAKPRWAELHLDVRATGSQLEATWDGGSARASGATRALLGITEGTEHRDVPLSESQLQSGRYSWQRSSTPGDVVVRLIVYNRGIGSTGDAIRLTALPATTPSAPAASTPAAAPAPAPSTVAVTVEPKAPRGGSPPEIVNQVQPFVPEGIRARIEGRITVPVEVLVSSTGRVYHAKALNAGNSSVYHYLAGLAETAARQSRFSPAKSRHGTRVGSAATMQFVFTR